MSDPLLGFVSRYRGKALLLDTNLLVLWCVGSQDKLSITPFKRTNTFTMRDFDVLDRFIKYFHKMVTTPNVLTKASDLLRQAREPLRSAFMQQLEGVILAAEEIYVRSQEICLLPDFYRLGLADLANLEAGKQGHLVLTGDSGLAAFMTRLALDVLRFDDIRKFAT